MVAAAAAAAMAAAKDDQMMEMMDNAQLLAMMDKVDQANTYFLFEEKVKEEEEEEEDNKIDEDGLLLRRRQGPYTPIGVRPHPPPDPIEFAKTCAGWTAQTMCGCVFGGGIDEAVCWDEDVAFIGRFAANYVINYEEKSVTGVCKLTPGCCTPANYTMKSIWRQDIGCTSIEEGMVESVLRNQDLGDQTPPPPLSKSVPWPYGEGYFPENSPAGFDRQCLVDAVQIQFDNAIDNTRAVVISFKDYLIYEQYDEETGINSDTRLLGWSATKSLTGSLVGVAKLENPLWDIYAPAPVWEWNEDEDDPRQEITVDEMMRMSSGTRWIGDLPPTTECLYYSDGDCAHTSAMQPLVTEPDAVWNYNSGSSYLLSRLALENRNVSLGFTNFDWPKKQFFHKIGAYNMYIEYQQNKVYLGGAYGYGTARDWTRYGVLHARRGVWVDGTRVLPEGWSEYQSTPSSTNSGYGAQMWLDNSRGMFYASGFRNENVFIFPDRQLVITRLAMPTPAAHPLFDRSAFLDAVLACFD